MTPTIMQYQRFRFFFFSREEKRKHVHAETPEGEAKFWLEPEIELAMNQGARPHDIAIIKKFIKDHFSEISDAWDKHFGH